MKKETVSMNKTLLLLSVLLAIMLWAVRKFVQTDHPRPPLIHRRIK